MLCRSICVKYDTFTNSAYISEQACLEQVLVVITERPLLVKLRFFPQFQSVPGDDF